MVRHLSFDEAKQLLDDEQSCVTLIKKTIHIPLLPVYLGNIMAGIRQQINKELELYSQEFDGVLLAYNNLQLAQPLGEIIDEQPCVHFEVRADFIVFKPTVGSTLTGIVNKFTKKHVGCLVHRCFNASLHKPREMEIQLGQEVLLKVTSVAAHNGVIAIKGKLQDTGLPKITSNRRKAHGDTPVDTVDGFSAVSENLSLATPETEGDSLHPKRKKKKKRDRHAMDGEMQSMKSTLEESEIPKIKRKKKNRELLHNTTSSIETEYSDSSVHKGSTIPLFNSVKTESDAIISNSTKKKRKHKKRITKS